MVSSLWFEWCNHEIITYLRVKLYEVSARFWCVNIIIIIIIRWFHHSRRGCKHRTRTVPSAIWGLAECWAARGPQARVPPSTRSNLILHEAQGRVLCLHPSLEWWNYVNTPKKWWVTYNFYNLHLSVRFCWVKVMGRYFRSVSPRPMFKFHRVWVWVMKPWFHHSLIR